MKRRQTKQKRFLRKQKRKTRRSTRRYQRGGSLVGAPITTGQRGGVNLPVPEGSVVSVDMDPKDPYSVPMLVSKGKYENEVLED